MDDIGKNQPHYQEYSHAIHFLNKVQERYRNNPQLYNRFRKILGDFQIKQQAIYKHNDSENNIKSIIQKIKKSFTELFKGDNAMYEEFLYFLPENNMPLISDVEQMERELIESETEEVIMYKIKVMNEIKDNIPRPVYKLFMRTLNLFANKIINYNELLSMLNDIMRTQYFDTLVQFIDAIEIKNKNEIDTSPVSALKKSQNHTTPSYVVADNNFRRLRERQHKPNNVLNESVLSLPYNSEDNKFKTNLRSEYEERMLIFEDDLYELGILISINTSITKKFEIFENQPEIEKQKDSPYFNNDQIVLNTIERSNIYSLYGSKGEVVINLLERKPSAAIPVVLSRCKRKLYEWEKIKESLVIYGKKLSVNRWISSLIGKKGTKQSRFKVKVNKYYLLSELKNAALYNESYSLVVNSPFMQDSEIENVLAGVLRKHKNFVINTPLTEIPAFLSQPAKLQQNRECYLLTFRYPCEKILHTWLYGFLKTVINTIQSSGSSSEHNNDCYFHDSEHDAANTYIDLLVKGNLDFVKKDYFQTKALYLWEKFMKSLFDIELTNDSYDGVSGISFTSQNQKNSKRYRGYIEDIKLSESPNYFLKNTKDPKIARRFYGDENWYLLLRYNTQLVQSSEKIANYFVNSREHWNGFCTIIVSYFSKSISAKRMILDFMKLIPAHYETLVRFVILIKQNLRYLHRVVKNKSSNLLFKIFDDYMYCSTRLCNKHYLLNLSQKNTQPISERNMQIQNIYYKGTETSHIKTIYYFEFNPPYSTIGMGFKKSYFEQKLNERTTNGLSVTKNHKKTNIGPKNKTTTQLKLSENSHDRYSQKDSQKVSPKDSQTGSSRNSPRTSQELQSEGSSLQNEFQSDKEPENVAADQNTTKDSQTNENPARSPKSNVDNEKLENLKYTNVEKEQETKIETDNMGNSNSSRVNRIVNDEPIEGKQISDTNETAELVVRNKKSESRENEKMEDDSPDGITDADCRTEEKEPPANRNTENRSDIGPETTDERTDDSKTSQSSLGQVNYGEANKEVMEEKAIEDEVNEEQENVEKGNDKKGNDEKRNEEKRNEERNGKAEQILNSVELSMRKEK